MKRGPLKEKVGIKKEHVTLKSTADSGAEPWGKERTNFSKNGWVSMARLFYDIGK